MAQVSLNELKLDREAPEPSRGRGWIWWLVVLALALVAALAWQRSRRGPAVHTALATEVDDSGPRTLLNASGYVTARRAATVSAKITAKVTEVLIEEGMRVEAGHVLARLDDTNVRASLAHAEAQQEAARLALAETEAQLALAELEQRRARDLVSSKAAPQSDLDYAETEVKTYRARLNRQQAESIVAAKAVALWQQQLEDTVIRAPFSGVVTTKNAQPGEMISPISAGGGFTRTGIGTLVDMTSLEIEVDVNESNINRVKADQAVEATLDAYPDWRIPSKVIAIVPTADRQKATVRVRVGFEKLDPRILPEMAVKVAFLDSSEPTTKRPILIPRAALRKADGRDIVFTVQQGVAARRLVKIQTLRSGEALLETGIQSGETVILDPPEVLRDGARVRPVLP